jgi:hypothetical protein
MKKKSILIKAAAASLAMAAVAGAHAAPLGQVLSNAASNNFSQTSMFITAFMYVAGIAMGAAGIFKLRDYMKDSDRNSLKVPAGLLLAASLALALPSYLKTGVDTTFGGGATMNSISGTTDIR